MMNRVRAKFAGSQAILWALVCFMMLPTLLVLADENVNNPDDDQSTAPRLFLEPIAGLTTTRHLAPSQTAIPLGTVLELFLEVPSDARVNFSGATVTSRNADGITATCLLDRVGPALIAAISEMSDGTRHMSACRLEVVSIAIGDITATVTTPTVAPFNLDEYASNADTMSTYFGESIADLVETTTLVSGAVAHDGGRGRPRPASVTRRFRTSTARRVTFHTDIDPPAFTPLMEWRIDGLGRGLGGELNETFASVGAHTVSVGPLNRPILVVVDTYSVSITSHDSGGDIVPQGEWVRFEAVTDPPGLESGIRWVSSTKYGTASPVVGHGSTFTVQFNDTYGLDEATGEPFEWLGVRADNALFGQDQKPSIDCCEEGQDPFATNATIPSSITFGSTDIPPIPADFFGPGSDPVGSPIPFSVDVVGAPRANKSGIQCGSADTFVRRLGPVICPSGPPFPTTCRPVHILMAGLSLTGTAPITVTFHGGMNPETWLLALGAPVQERQGLLNATLQDANGGTYTASLPVEVTVALVRESAALAPGPGDILKLTRTVDMGLSSPVPWSRNAPTDGGFFCAAQGFDMGNPFYPGEPSPGLAGAEQAVACDTCIQCSGAGCHGGPGHAHCMCRPVPCQRCRYDVAVRIPFPFCIGPSFAPNPLRSAFICNTMEPDAVCCGSPLIPPVGVGLFPCLFGGTELVVYANAVVCDP